MRRAAALTLLAVLAGCGGGGETLKGPPPAATAPATLRLTSPVLTDGATVPRRFTCDGADAVPPLRVAGVPRAAVALALTMEDPDAPGGTFVHWTSYDFPARDGAVPPAGARTGENSFGGRGYRGPCPPRGDRAHRYVLTVYALRARLGLPAGAKPAEVRRAIARTATARGVLTGRYGRG